MKFLNTIIYLKYSGYTLTLYNILNTFAPITIKYFETTCQGHYSKGFKGGGPSNGD